MNVFKSPELGILRYLQIENFKLQIYTAPKGICNLTFVFTFPAK